MTEETKPFSAFIAHLMPESSEEEKEDARASFNAYTDIARDIIERRSREEKEQQQETKTQIIKEVESHIPEITSIVEVKEVVQEPVIKLIPKQQVVHEKLRVEKKAEQGRLF